MRKTKLMFIVLAISTLFLAKEASWGGDRKIKETIIASPRIDIVPSAGRFSSNFKHFKEKRRRKQAKNGVFSMSLLGLFLVR
jgi:hypothetical protein